MVSTVHTLSLQKKELLKEAHKLKAAVTNSLNKKDIFKAITKKQVPNFLSVISTSYSHLLLGGSGAYVLIFNAAKPHEGGTLLALCEHSRCYGIKYLLRAEGTRDPADVVLSFRNLPRVVVYDDAESLAASIFARKPTVFQASLPPLEHGPSCLKLLRGDTNRTAFIDRQRPHRT